MFWVILAVIAALSTSLTNIFAKIGIKGVNSNFATAYRTLIVIIFSLLLTIISGSISNIENFTFYNYLFLSLSSLMTFLSWICFFKAIKIGNINKVLPIENQVL